MKPSVAAAAAALILMPALDFAWLALMSQRFYAPRLSHLLAAQPRYGPLIVFYLIYAAALLLLVVFPAQCRNETAPKAFALGAILGLAAYGAYDLVNQATLRDWPLAVTLVDMAYGALATGVTAAVALTVAKRCS